MRRKGRRKKITEKTFQTKTWETTKISVNKTIPGVYRNNQGVLWDDGMGGKSCFGGSYKNKTNRQIKKGQNNLFGHSSPFVRKLC